jgi:hypothetical protein
MKITIKTSSTAAMASFLLVGMTGCSGQEPPPLELLGAAKMAVQDAAQNNQTAQFAPAELQSAQQKVSAADQAVDQGENVKARRLSEQAIADAQLAKAKTLTAQSKIGAQDERDALQGLQNEIRRNK